jgi:hypothetical protein
MHPDRYAADSPRGVRITCKTRHSATVGQASPDGPSTPREWDPAEDSTEDSTPPRVEHRLLEPYGMAEPNLHRR